MAGGGDDKSGNLRATQDYFVKFCGFTPGENL